MFPLGLIAAFQVWKAEKVQSLVPLLSHLFGNSQHFWQGFTAHPNHGWQPKATILFTGSFVDFLHSESAKFTNF